MIKRLTAYEIQKIINHNFQNLCSDSMGSIQVAIKKLLKAEQVVYKEYVERNVNKKQYSVTEEGRKAFIAWINIPADLSNIKMMELGKLFFMGFVPVGNRLALINEIILSLRKKLDELLTFQASIQLADGIEQTVSYWEKDLEYCKGVQESTQNSDIMESANEIGNFQMLTLQYEIDFVKFQIQWFENLKGNVKKERVSNDE